MLPETPDGFQRRFSVADADQLIPHLEAVFRDMRSDAVQLQVILQLLAPYGVAPGRQVPDHAARNPALVPQIQRLVRVQSRVQARIASLTEMGVVVRGLDGLVDVLSRYEGREVYLCWRTGERRFHFWHELNTGFEARRPIVDRNAYSGTLLS